MATLLAARRREGAPRRNEYWLPPEGREEEDEDDDYALLLQDHEDQRAKVLSVSRINLPAENTSDYNREGFNVRLEPLPSHWAHEDLRSLLTRVAVPCPMGWNVHPKRSCAWLDFEYPREQRTAIELLDGLLLPDGTLLNATPVDPGGEKRKRPPGYRDCDDGRVDDDWYAERKAQQAAQAVDADEDVIPETRKRPREESTMVEDGAVTPGPGGEGGEGATIDVEAPPAKRRQKGRGFTSRKMHADTEVHVYEHVAVSTVKDEPNPNRPGAAGVVPLGSLGDDDGAIITHIGPAKVNNRALLEKYRAILDAIKAKRQAAEPLLDDDDDDDGGDGERGAVLLSTATLPPPLTDNVVEVVPPMPIAVEVEA